MVRKDSRHDFTIYVHDLASKMEKSSFKCQPDEAWKVLKRLIGLAPGNKYSAVHCLPLLYDHDHVPVSTAEDKLRAFFEHFTKMELAEPVTSEQLIAKCHSVGPTTVAFTPVASNIMGPFQFGARISRVSTGLKAPGFDCSMPDLAQVDVEQYTRLLHPLHVKMAITATEPLQLKGSINATVRKKGSATNTCADHRAITLRNHLLKVHHSFLRSLAYPLLHAALHIAQTGGVKKRGTDISNALVRWNLCNRQEEKECTMTFFSDVTSAFYTMIRQLVVPVAHIFSDIEDIINQIGIPLAFVEPLRILLSKPSTLEEVIPDKHLLAMLSETQRIPWFQLQGYAAIGCTKTGSGPGGPLADLMYNLAMLPAIDEIDDELVSSGLVFTTHTNTSVFTDTGRIAQGRDALSPAAVTAFVDDLSGSAPLDPACLYQCFNFSSEDLLFHLHLCACAT